MASGKQFVYADSTISIPRSSFPMNNRWQGDIYHGDLVPVDILEVLPSDSFKVKVNSFIRTSTPPIAPLMDSITACIAAFFVPKRLVWTPTKKFYGENEEGYGIQSEVLEPRVTGSDAGISVEDVTTFPHSFGKYFGLVRQTATSSSPIALNPSRAFLQVYNDWFRNENFHDPYLWTHNQTGDLAVVWATLDGVGISSHSDLPKVCKQLDVFTSALPWAQKLSNPVLLPLLGQAPVVTASTDNTFTGIQPSLHWVNATNFTDAGPGNLETTTFGRTMLISGSQNTGTVAIPANLKADLSQATACSVNQLRVAVATQRYFETLARTGSKYREYILGIYGCSIGDTTAQMAEYLGGCEIKVNVDQVLQTTGYASGQSSTLGRPGAVSVTGSSEYLWTKSFQEPGYVITVMYFKHQRSYSQGVDEIWKKHELFDYYNPKFAHVGEVPKKKSTIYWTGNSLDDDESWGFQEYGNEYHYKKDTLIGLLSPANSTVYNFWNLGDKYSTKPTLNGDFLKEDRNAISRCLQGGTLAPDYFVDLYFERNAVRPMPLHSIPGLMDHF